MPDIHHIFHIEASFETIFKAIGTVEGLKKWWTEDVVGDHRQTGELRFGFGDGLEAKFLVKLWEPNDELIWHYKGEEGDEWYGTVVRFRLTSNEGKVRIDFEHNHYKNANDFYAQCNFTWARYLISLRNYCETGKGDPFRIL